MGLSDNAFWNLKRMDLLLDRFGRPEKSFFPILIAGTKGKGSAGFFLESILTAAGIPAGFYSSPHLESPLERIRIRGKILSRRFWTAGLSDIRRSLMRKRLPVRYGAVTYFEVMTLLAMLVFKRAGMRIGIFEAGMGGRLDAVNVLDAPIAILTPVSLDHEAFLGRTIGKITREKAAVIRPHSDVITGGQTEEAFRVIRATVRHRKAALWPGVNMKRRCLGLAGDFQKVNAGLAARAAFRLRDRFGYAIPESAISKGLRASHWPGRMERFPGEPAFLLDAAHNPASILALVNYLGKAEPLRPKVIVFGVSRDKNSKVMLQSLSRLKAPLVLTRFPNPRSQELGVLLAQAHGLFPAVLAAENPREAMEFAKGIAGRKGLITATGSFYLIGAVRKQIIGKLGLKD